MSPAISAKRWIGFERTTKWERSCWIRLARTRSSTAGAWSSSSERSGARLFLLTELAEVIGHGVGIAGRHGFGARATHLIGVLLFQLAAQIQFQPFHLRQHFVAQAIRELGVVADVARIQC